MQTVLQARDIPAPELCEMIDQNSTRLAALTADSKAWKPRFKADAQKISDKHAARLEERIAQLKRDERALEDRARELDDQAEQLRRDMKDFDTARQEFEQQQQRQRDAHTAIQLREEILGESQRRFARDLQSHEQQQKQLGDDTTSLDRRQDLLLTAEIEERERLAGDRKDIQNELSQKICDLQAEVEDKSAAIVKLEQKLSDLQADIDAKSMTIAERDDSLVALRSAAKERLEQALITTGETEDCLRDELETAIEELEEAQNNAAINEIDFQKALDDSRSDATRAQNHYERSLQDIEWELSDAIAQLEDEVGELKHRNNKATIKIKYLDGELIWLQKLLFKVCDELKRANKEYDDDMADMHAWLVDLGEKYKVTREMYYRRTDQLRELSMHLQQDDATEQQ